MKIPASTSGEYISQLPGSPGLLMSRLDGIIKQNPPNGFEEEMNKIMTDCFKPPKLYFQEGQDYLMPLPFINSALQKSQKVLLYVGLFFISDLKLWFRKTLLCIGNQNLILPKALSGLKSTA
ncbi:MAG: hypothetical protein EOM06_11640 [Sphingobacteriia bacterium]|nr:hypothetical protein [Sphingobacteriia bacterium]